MTKTEQEKMKKYIKELKKENEELKKKVTELEKAASFLINIFILKL